LAELKKTQLLSEPTVNQPSSPEFDVQSALEAGEIGVWDWDLTNDRMCWSEQMFRNIGLDPDRSGDLYQRLLTAIYPTDQKSVAAAFTEFRKRPGPVRVEARLVWPGGEPHWIVFLGRTVAGADGVPTRMHGVTIDSTRRRQNEDASAGALSESGRRLSELSAK
jgi:PAS domain-containing protein